MKKPAKDLLQYDIIQVGCVRVLEVLPKVPGHPDAVRILAATWDDETVIVEVDGSVMVAVGAR